MRNADGRICGEEHHRTKVPDEVVLKLRDLYETGQFSLQELVDRFPQHRLTKRNVHSIVTYQTRGYVKPQPLS